MPDSGSRDQLEKTHQAVLKATGVNMKVMRPPRPRLRVSRNAVGFWRRIWVTAAILWDVDPLDWVVPGRSPCGTGDSGAYTFSGSIILSHDIHKSAVDAMPGTIDGLVAEGLPSSRQ